MSRTHNELSQVNVLVEPLDINGNPYIPTTAKYRVDDCNTDKQLVDWTPLTPALEMTIEIPASANAIIVKHQVSPESKVVTVLTDEGLATQHYAEYIYRIKDLKFVA